MKKLKVLFNLLAMFSLFSLTSVSAKEEDNIFKISNEFSEEKSENLFIDNENCNEDNVCDDYDFFYGNDLSKIINEEDRGNDHEKNLFCSSVSTKMIGRKRNSSLQQQYSMLDIKKTKSGETTQEILQPQGEIIKLLENFKIISKYGDLNELFVKIMNAYGKCPKSPNIFSSSGGYRPFIYKVFDLEDGKVKFKNFDFKTKDSYEKGSLFVDSDFEGEDRDLFTNLMTKGSNLWKYFGNHFDIIFRMYYKNCYKESLNSSIDVFDFNNIKHEISRKTLQDNFNYYYNTLKNNPQAIKDYRQMFTKLIDMFFSEGYLKSFFIFYYRKIYDFYSIGSEDRNDLIRFSEIFSKALKCEFNDKGYLESMKLDFSSAIKSSDDFDLLKHISISVENNETKNLLYRLLGASLIFLQQKEFWNKMFEILIYFKVVFYNQKRLKFISSYENFKDYDFDNLHERFKYIFLMLAKDEGKKGFLSNETNDLEEKGNDNFIKSSIFKTNFDYENKDKYKYKEFTLCDYDETDKKLKKDLNTYFNCRFKPSFTISSDFKWLTREFFDSLYNENDDVYYKLLKEGDFYVSKNFMLEYLYKKLENEKIREECLSFIKFLLKMYLTKGFVTAYGDKLNKYAKNSVFDIFCKYLDDVLDVRFEKDKLGHYRLKLGLKKDSNLNCTMKDIESSFYTNKMIHDFIIILEGNYIDGKEKFINAEINQKLGYRLYLSILAFIKEENFLNNLLAFLVCNHSINIARNIVSDSKTLYNEYKDTDNAYSEYLKDYVNSKPKKIIIKDKIKSYKDIFNSSEKDILESTKSFKDFSNFEKNADNEALIDKDFVNYILNINNYKESAKNESSIFNLVYYNKDFAKDCSDIMKCRNKRLISENFSRKFCYFNEILKKNIEDVISDFENVGITDRYCVDFSCLNLEGLLKDLCVNIYLKPNKKNASEYEKQVAKYKYNYDYDSCYKLILENNKIVNECVSFIERFFRYYISKLSFCKNLGYFFISISNPYKNCDNIVKARGARIDALKNIVKPILEWFSNMFEAKVEDKKIKFHFNLGHVNEEVSPYVKIFFDAIKKYSKNTADSKNMKCQEKETYENKLKSFIFMMFLDVLAFLNSEDLWNEYMKGLLVNKFLNFSKPKDQNDNYYYFKNNNNNSYFDYNIFDLKDEFLDVEKKIKDK